MKNNGALSGMKRISEYVSRSEPTVLAWIRNNGFPARKIGGIWESKKDKIDEWKEKFLKDYRT